MRLERGLSTNKTESSHETDRADPPHGRHPRTRWHTGCSPNLESSAPSCAPLPVKCEGLHGQRSGVRVRCCGRCPAHDDDCEQGECRPGDRPETCHTVRSLHIAGLVFGGFLGLVFFFFGFLLVVVKVLEVSQFL